MNGQSVNTATRELTTDEFLMVAGAKPMEVEASRYLAPMVCTFEVANRCYVWGRGGIGTMAAYAAARVLEDLRGK